MIGCGASLLLAHHDVSLRYENLSVMETERTLARGSK